MQALSTRQALRPASGGRANARASAAAPAALQRCPAYKGAAVLLRKGERLKVINTHGQQGASREGP